MDEENLESLKREIVATGWSENKIEDLDEMLRSAGQPTAVVMALIGNARKHLVTWQLEKAKDEKFVIGSIDHRMVLPPDLPQKMVQGFDVEELDKRLGKINWAHPETYEALYNTGSAANKAFVDLATLPFMGRVGIELFELLAYKHLAGTLGEPMVPNMDEITMKYDSKVQFEPKTVPFSLEEIGSILHGRYVFKPGGAHGPEIGGWHKLDKTRKDEQGFSPIVNVGQSFDLPAALEKAGILHLGHPLIYEELQKALARGNVINLPMHKGDVYGMRAFFADPENNTLRIDTKETARRGLYEHTMQMPGPAKSEGQNPGGKGRADSDGPADDDDRGRGKKR